VAQNSSNLRPGLQPFFDDAVLRLCSVASLVLVCMPADGIPGVELCLFRFWTGLPCPGCGLTRSGAHLLRGHIARAFNYNPFGLVIIPAILLLGLVGVAPRPWRTAFWTRLQPWGRPLFVVFLVILFGLLVFGWLRCLWVWQGWSDFPAAWL
jgi:hypothetical protein